MGWVSPDGHSDPKSVWSSESSAYDEDTGSEAYTSRFPYKYLELTLSTPINCDKIRIYCADCTNGTCADQDVVIDVYYNSDWHNIFTGTVTKKTWVEKAIGSTETVDKARVKKNSAVYTYFNLFEFDFNEAEAPPPSYISQLMMIT